MGALVSRLTNPTIDFPSLLSSLDTSIRETRLQLTKVAASRRSKVNAITKYTIFACIAIIIWAAIEKPWRDWRFIAAAIGTPTLGYCLGVIVNYWYNRKLNAIQFELDTLIATQKLKVEELKKKTGFYATKDLLERYESESTRKGPNPTKEPPLRPVPFQELQSSKESAENSNQLLQITPGSPPINIDGTPPSSANAQGREMYQRMHELQPTNRTWLDRLLDMIAGEEAGPSNRFALICENCYAHNGLAIPEEFETLKYSCPKCGHLNQRHDSGDVALAHLPTVASSPNNPFEVHPKPSQLVQSRSRLSGILNADELSEVLHDNSTENEDEGSVSGSTTSTKKARKRRTPRNKK